MSVADQAVDILGRVVLPAAFAYIRRRLEAGDDPARVEADARAMYTATTATADEYARREFGRR